MSVERTPEDISVTHEKVVVSDLPMRYTSEEFVFKMSQFRIVLPQNRVITYRFLERYAFSKNIIVSVQKSFSII